MYTKALVRFCKLHIKKESVRQIPWGAIRAPAVVVPGVVREFIRKA